MQYKCDVCHDSGSKNKTGDYLDCPACDMPHTRKALNDFVKSLGPTHPEDVALAIHQRALAMAPKQEAQPNLEPLRKWAKDAANGKTDKIPYIDITNLINENIELRAAFAASGGNAAPAAANGALPELPAPATLIVESDLGHRAYTADQMRAYGQACAAAGLDTMLVKALEEVIKECCAWYFELSGQDGERLPAIKQARSALSGAKGN